MHHTQTLAPLVGQDRAHDGQVHIGLTDPVDLQGRDLAVLQGLAHQVQGRVAHEGPGTVHDAGLIGGDQVDAQGLGDLPHHGLLLGAHPRLVQAAEDLLEAGIVPPLPQQPLDGGDAVDHIARGRLGPGRQLLGRCGLLAGQPDLHPDGRGEQQDQRHAEESGQPEPPHAWTGRGLGGPGLALNVFVARRLHAPPPKTSDKRRSCAPQWGVQVLPLCPNPPSPRAESANSCTRSKRARTTGTRTSWAMRSPTSILKAPAPRFQHETRSWPW